MTNPKCPAPWKWTDASELGEDQMPRLEDANGDTVCDFGSETQYYPTEGSPPSEPEATLIALAPEMADMLRFARLSLETFPGHACKPGCNLLACKVDVLLARIDGAKEGT